MTLLSPSIMKDYPHTSKKQGRLIKCNRYGKEYLRRTPVRFKDANTPSQQLQRGRMDAVIPFYRQFKGTLIPQIWKIAAEKAGCSGYNLFVGQNMKAFDREGNIFDFPAVTLSKGTLPMPAHQNIEETGADFVTLSWDEAEGFSGQREEDRMIAGVIYESEPFEVFFCPVEKVRRKDFRARIPLERKGEGAVHLYVFWSNGDSTRFSDQCYFEIR